MAELTIRKHVPNERVNAYLNLGWEKPNFQGAVESNETCLTKVVRTAASTNDEVVCSFREPYLIQRALIRRPLGKYADATLTEAVAFDYMGAAEFEFGALPKSLRCSEAQWQLYNHHIIDGLTARREGKEYALRMYANFEWTELEQRGKQGPLQVPERTDFWWDIKNCVFFAFDKQFMARVDNHLRASFKRMAVAA